MKSDYKVGRAFTSNIRDQQIKSGIGHFILKKHLLLGYMWFLCWHLPNCETEFNAKQKTLI